MHRVRGTFLIEEVVVMPMEQDCKVILAALYGGKNAWEKNTRILQLINGFMA